MKIKKLEVSSIQEAIEILEREYGENAVILSSRVVKKRRLGFLPIFSKKMLEVTIGIKEEEDFRKEVERERELLREIESLKRIVSELVSNGEGKAQAHQKDEQYSSRVRRVFEKMVLKSVNREIAEKLVEDACGYDLDNRVYDFKDEPFRSIRESFEKNIKIEEGFLENPPRVVALVGPTGVGKTTTIAKLAHLLKKHTKRIGIITLDAFRVGAYEQLRKYAEVLGVPFKSAETPKDFGEKLLSMGDLDVVLVDTAGRSHYDVVRLKELEAFFKVSEISTYLTIAANLSELVMYEAIMQFGAFSIKGLIFTKLDETPCPGSIINVAYRTQYPILCFTTGQILPDDIVMANYDYLVRLILEDEDENRPAVELTLS
ncbi:MAG: flagellar biosynthesis protein FlhF [Aquificae bacterium]|nr:flagellar biosynthesis protein FlhF [Aquificota bacterium]